jgi:RNA polymerase sigma factor (sigma-70 family)
MIGIQHESTGANPATAATGAEGNQDWVAYMEKRYRKRLMWFAQSRTEDYHLAEDLVQEVFLKLCTVSRLDCKPAWLFRICRTLVYKAWEQRRIGRIRHFADADASPFTYADRKLTPAKMAAERETLTAVEEAIASLPSPIRECARLRLICGAEKSDIGIETGLRISEVRTNLNQAIVALRLKFPGHHVSNAAARIKSRHVERREQPRELWCVGMNRQFEGVLDAVKRTGISEDAIYRALNGKCGGMAGGHKWEWREWTAEKVEDEARKFDRFVASRCVLRGMAVISRRQLYSAYLQWCQSIESKPLNQHPFYARIRRLDGVLDGPVSAKMITHWLGITLISVIACDA